MKFHGKDITSDMTLDEAYIEGTGMSLEEWRQEDRKRADISLEKRIEEIRSKDIDDRTDEEKQIIGEYEAREEGYQIVPYNEENRRMSSVDGIHNLLKQNQEENGQKYCMVYEGYRINSDMDLSEVYINHDDYMKKKTDAILQKPEDQRSIEEKATLQMYEDEIEDQKMTLKFQKEIIENTLKRPEEEINAVAKESLRIAKERVRVIEALNSHREERERAEKLKNMKEQEEWYKNEMEELGKVKPFDPGISLTDVICGTAFVLSNGTLVTARQNIQPWFFYKELGGEWRVLMAEYVAAGCKVIIDYDAYNTAGTAHKLTFNNLDFVVDTSGDRAEETITITKDVRARLKDNGIEISKSKKVTYSLTVYTPWSQCYALLPGKSSAGIPYDAGKSLSSDGGTEIQVAGFKDNPNIHNLPDYVSYFKSSTSRTDTKDGNIILQDANRNPGYLGSPAFVKETNGAYRAIGVMVGQLRGEDKLVPIAKCN